MSQLPKHIVIVGGGITGLSAAFYVKKYCAEANVPVRITIVEKQNAFGGRVSTMRHEGFVIERGPDSFLARKTPIIDLAHELGIADELVPTNPKARKTFIMHSGKLHQMPKGLVLGIPTQLAPFIQSDLVSWRGKARALLDIFKPKKPYAGDESLGHFIERRLGSEMLERVVEPLLAGIYAGDTRKLSIQATFPQFQQMEQTKRSLILGMMGGSERVPSSPNVPEHAQGSAFLSFRNGLSTMIEKLQDKLHDAEQLSNTEVESIIPSNQASYTLKLSNGSELHADSVVIAVPAYALAQMMPQINAVQQFGQMRYISVSNVVIGYRKEDVPNAPDGSGFVIPGTERRFITACTWTSSKWEHTAPDDKILLRCYVGREGQEEWMKLDEQQIIQKVLQEVRETSGITAAPEFTYINRHMQSMPQYEVGHKTRIANIREKLAEKLPGVYATGAAFEGVGLPDCIRQGRDAAKEAVQFIR